MRKVDYKNIDPKSYFMNRVENGVEISMIFHKRRLTEFDVFVKILLPFVCISLILIIIGVLIISYK